MKTIMPDIKEIKHWSIHAIICATPNFVIAYTSGFNRLESILAMLFTIVCFIFVYASICSRSSFKSGGKRNKFRETVKIGAKIRSGVSLLGIFGAVVGMGVPFSSLFTAPDMMAGMLAIGVTSSLLGLQGIPGRNYEVSNNAYEAAGFLDIHLIGRIDAFFPTMMTTAIEGLIISLTILAISSLIVLFRSFILGRRAKLEPSK